MRLTRGEPVAGIDPELARALARVCQPGWTPLGRVGKWVKEPRPEDLAALLERLVAADFLMRRDGLDGPEWTTTTKGGGLAMASFLKPINRPKADALVADVVARAAAYNEDTTKLFQIDTLTAFGSYADPDAVDFGDIDLAVTFTDREQYADRAKVHLAYSHASGRTFSRFTDELFWPETEMLRAVRGRSPYVNVHTEDITSLARHTKIIYTMTEPDGI